MSLRNSILALALATVSAFVVSGNAQADDKHDGEDLNVHNNTGHEVVVFLFQDDKVHLDETGGVQFAHIKTGESAVAHAPHCKFSVLLVDHEDVWHAEFHDCHSTDMTFTKDTNHAKHAHH
ncbi:MAG: hypothetical protein NT062_11415 [Proteobacteria bacterium]|nr:hypothetical protein [Pseudomonadota bacterium]